MSSPAPRKGPPFSPDRKYKPGDSIPPVDAGDLRIAWGVMMEHPGEAVSTAVWAGECSPGADVLAVAYRAALILGILTERFPRRTGQDPLGPWRQGQDLDDAVLRAAAKFPFALPVFSKFPGFDVEAFIQVVRDEKQDETSG
jgi:hypothetical protein